MMNRRTFLAALLAATGGQLLGPLPGSARTRPTPILRVAVISDLNHSYGTIGYDPPIQKVVKKIIALKPDLVLCTGDMIAGQRTSPKLLQKRLESMWRSFFQTVVHPLAKAGIPLAVTPGNHDASAVPGFQLERKVFAEQWAQNRDALSLLPGGSYPFYYAFVLKNVLFISLDVTVTSPMQEAQKSWLTELLAGAEKYRARIVQGHIPFAPLTVGRERSFLRDNDLEQLLVRNNVSLYLSGHQHGFYPFYHNGLHCVGQAAIGSGPRRLIGTAKRSPRAFTLLEIAPDGVIKVSAFAGSNFNQPLRRTTLPPKISLKSITAIRDDLKQ
jgi:hypothetical protein